MRSKPIDQKQFFKHCRKTGCFWIKCYCKKPYSYNAFYSARFNRRSIANLYMYRDAPDIPMHEKSKAFLLLYGPLGMRKQDWDKVGYLTLRKVLEIAKKNRKMVLASNSWWREVRDFYDSPRIDLLKNSIILRKLDGGKFEIIDGNHRIIAKLLKTGFTFTCNAFVIAKV